MPEEIDTNAEIAAPTTDGLSRRDIIKTAALLGGSSLLAGVASACVGQTASVQLPNGPVPYPGADAENQIYTVCLNCNTGCGIKAKIVDGVVAKIDGNPLSPWTMTPHLPYATSILETAQVDSALCPKGQAGVLTAYDPYRITRVLKRAGKRGEQKWQSIPFNQAIAEIVDGGLLFKNVPGEEQRQVTGLKDLWKLRDAAVARALAADADRVAKKQMTLAEFKAKHQANLSTLIDPDHPDFGPINNQFVFAWGRLKGGRSDLINRFTRDALGSTNAHGHTTVCQGSLYFTGKAMSEQYVEGKWTGGKKFYWQADAGNAEFIIFVGASPFEGNYGPPHRVPKITNGLVDGRLKYAVVDPRLSKTAAKAWKWLPNKPGSEGALALGIINWVIQNERYDSRFLRNANRGAATTDGEPSFTNASWLVRIEPDGPGGFLRASEIGMPVETRKTASGADYTFDPFVVMVGGKPTPFDPYDDKVSIKGDLAYKGSVEGIPVKTGFQIIAESAAERTMEQVAEITGLKAADITDLAREFVKHGKKAVADIHRGVSQHTNGFYNVLAWYTLNALVGNYDWKGGLSSLSTWDISGAKPGQPFAMGAMAGKAAPFGISIIRHDVKFDETTLYEGKYPAKRQFYPLASDIYQEIFPSIGDAYPYPVKALILYMGSPVYALPAGHTLIEMLADPAKLPLFITNDIVVGETSMYSDYIFPDLSFLERWEFHGSHPSIPQKVQPIRQPAMAPLTETVMVFGKEMPISLEAMLLGIAERLKLPGFGKDGLGTGIDFNSPDDYYLRMVANVAAGERADGTGAVPDATEQEMEVFLKARRFLPKTVFDADRWKAIVGDRNWRKVVYVLNRGGRFDDFEMGYSGEKLRNPHGNLINLYQEKTAKVKNAMTGKRLLGYAAYLPASADILGNPVNDEPSGYNLQLITFREMAMTKSRTAANYWLLGLLPENSMLMNSRDAARLGVKTGDLVRLTSATNTEGSWDLRNGKKVPMIGKARVIEGIRPGVVAFSLGHGHWAYGAQDVIIDGTTVPADARRAGGFHGNAAMRIDPVLKNTTLSDPVGASAVFYDTKVKVEKV